MYVHHNNGIMKVKRQTTDGKYIFATNRVSKGLASKIHSLKEKSLRKRTIEQLNWGNYMKGHSVIKKISIFQRGSNWVDVGRFGHGRERAEL